MKPGSGGGGKDGGRKKSRKARVVSVTDGDTIKVRIKRRTKDVRLIGIDTPEVYGGVECGGREASRSMKGMLDRGDRVRLIRDRSQDGKDRRYWSRLSLTSGR
jgi:endonuclease YncB( thermonuclease family)